MAVKKQIQEGCQQSFLTYKGTKYKNNMLLNWINVLK